MSEIVVVEQQDLVSSEWKARSDVVAFGKRIKAMLPGGDRLSDTQAMALSQYSLAMNLNPFRGEVYGYPGPGNKLVIVDGYKALVRWAHWRMPYTETFEALEPGDPELPADAIGYRCGILREDNRAFLFDLIRAGAPYSEAKQMTHVYAVGVVTKNDRTTRAGAAADPPTGWTWDAVARKRALKNALNMSHGMPAPGEIQRAMAEVEGWQHMGALADPLPERDTARVVESPRGSSVLFKTDAGRKQVAQPEEPVEVGVVDGDWDPDVFEAGEDDDPDYPWDLKNDPRDQHDDPEPANGNGHEPDPEPEPEPQAHNGKPVRPYDPETLRKGIRKRIDKQPGDSNSTKAQQGLIASKLEECFAGEPDASNKRHSVTEYLVGRASVKDMTLGEASALLDWLINPDTVISGTYDLNEHVAAEAHGVLRLVLVEAGQEEMPL